MQSLAGGVMAIVGGRPAEDVMFRQRLAGIHDRSSGGEGRRQRRDMGRDFWC
jgi:hypothetical protein